MLRSILQLLFGSLHCPIHLHWSCNCVIYQEITILSNLNEWFQYSPAVSNKVSGIFSHSWYYQIVGSTEITYNSYLLFLKFSSGPSSLVLKVQNELCDIIRTDFHVRKSPLCPGMSSGVWPQGTRLSSTKGGNVCAAPFSASLRWQCLQLLFHCARGTAE